MKNGFYNNYYYQFRFVYLWKCNVLENAKYTTNLLPKAMSDCMSIANIVSSSLVNQKWKNGV